MNIYGILYNMIVRHENEKVVYWSTPSNEIKLTVPYDEAYASSACFYFIARSLGGIKIA